MTNWLDRVSKALFAVMLALSALVAWRIWA